MFAQLQVVLQGRLTHPSHLNASQWTVPSVVVPIHHDRSVGEECAVREVGEGGQFQSTLVEFHFGSQRLLVDFVLSYSLYSAFQEGPTPIIIDTEHLKSLLAS